MSVLDDEAFRFCHEPGADGADARAWCEVLSDAPPDSCPGLRESCNGAWAPDPIECVQQGGSWFPTSNPGGAPEAPRQIAEGCEEQSASSCISTESNVTAPLWLRWAAALVVMVFVGVVARHVFHWLGSPKRPSLPAAPHAPSEDEVPDRPAPDLLAEAAAALEAGRFAETIERSRAAALRALGTAGRIRLHRSRTDRDYARELRPDVELSPVLRVVLTHAESVRWARRPSSREDAVAALTAARSVLGAVLPALLFFVAFPAFADERWEPDGDAALYDVVDAGAWVTDRRAIAWDALDSDDHLVVLDTTAVWITDDDATSLMAWVHDGGLLWVIGDPPESMATGVHASQPVRSRLVMLSYETSVPRLPSGPERAFLGVDEDVEYTAEWWVEPRDDHDPVRCTEEDPCGVLEAPKVAGVAMYSCRGKGAIGVIADPRVSFNAAFVDPHNAVALRQMFQRPVAVCGLALPLAPAARFATRTSSRVDPAGALAAARLLPAVAQLLVGWSVLAWALGVPFGRPRDPADSERRAFSDHLRALANRWKRGGATHWPLAKMASYWLHRRGADRLARDAAALGWSPEKVAHHVTAWTVAASTPTSPDSPADREHLEALWSVLRRR